MTHAELKLKQIEYDRQRVAAYEQRQAAEREERRVMLQDRINPPTPKPIPVPTPTPATPASQFEEAARTIKAFARSKGVDLTAETDELTVLALATEIARVLDGKAS